MAAGFPMLGMPFRGVGAAGVLVLLADLEGGAAAGFCCEAGLTVPGLGSEGVSFAVGVGVGS